MTEDILDFQPGATLQGTPYRVVRKIGAGGMGAVFEVEHVRLKKRLMAKTLLPGLRGRQDYLTRMEVEAQTLARIAHPNIVQVHDLGVTDDGIPFFVMEKLEGSDLRKLLRARRYLDLPDALTIVEDVLEALAHAHREGVVHRDIKPENIFLARSGAETVAKILDFGIVHVMDDSKNLTGQRFLGTCQYAAPEQLHGHKPSEKTDIYAVGCVLFELVTGRRPFLGPTTQDYIRQHLHDVAPRLSTLVPGISPELDALVASALEKDPALRPIGALWFASQLHRVQLSAAHVVLAEANTTEEMLLTSITEGAASSNPVAATEQHTDRDPAMTPEPHVAVARATLLARGQTERLPGSPAPPTSEQKFRREPTRTGKPVEIAKTEKLTESGGDIVAAHLPAGTDRQKEERRAPSRSHDAASVVVPIRPLIPNGPWVRRAIIAAPVVIGAVVAAVIVVRASREERASDPTQIASAIARPVAEPPSAKAPALPTAAAAEPHQASIAPTTASASARRDVSDAGAAPLSSGRLGPSVKGRKAIAFEPAERAPAPPASVAPSPPPPPAPSASSAPPPQRDDSLMRTL